MTARHLAALAPLLLLAAGCGSTERANPVPADLADRAQVPGFPEVRIWGDDEPEDYAELLDRDEETDLSTLDGVFGREHAYLSLSGGGADGAFGAGLLCGWTEEGSRPEFAMVSGISTGALIAPFAFLGPAYDDQLEEIYTSYGTSDMLVAKSALRAVTSDSAADTSRLVEKVRAYYDQDVLDAIAEESRRGRVLTIGTTNLDAKRPVIWNIGRIATSTSPDRLRLFQDVVIASAAIPGAFPPVYVEVEVDGVRYDEMHVDGGATSQLFLYPIGVDWKRLLGLLEVPGTPRVFAIRNSRLKPLHEPVDRSSLEILAYTLSSLFQASGQGDLYRVYLAAQRDGLEYNLAAIPEEFTRIAQEPFDREYMRELFALGRDLARNGYPWQDDPPGVDTTPDLER